MPLGGERFDLVLFNPPFLLGEPKDERDAAWRSNDAARRFAAGLGEHLEPGRVLEELPLPGVRLPRRGDPLEKRLHTL